MKFESRRMLALLLLFVIITGMAVSFGEKILCSGELPGAHESVNISLEHNAALTSDRVCPCVPSPSNSTSDHFCTGDCDCPCQAPLPSTAIIPICSRSFTYLYQAEPARHIPEVYLSLFVPPDSAAV